MRRLDQITLGEFAAWFAPIFGAMVIGAAIDGWLRTPFIFGFVFGVAMIGLKLTAKH